MMNLLTTGEIKSIERVCENLNRWRKDDIPQDFKELRRHSQLIMLVQPLINDVVVDLLAQMPDEGRLVRDKFEELLNQAKLVDDLREKASEDVPFEDSTLLRLAWEFILMLQRIAQKGSQDLTSKEPAEAEQNIAPAKRRGIRAWFKGLAKELYGLTIERVTKAYLDKYG